MFADLQYKLLKVVFPRGPNLGNGSAYVGKSKVETVLGREFLENLEGKTIIDFGCGEGDEVVEIAKFGAKRVIGLDYREGVLQAGRRRAAAASVESVCHFTQSTNETADIIVSLDTFEHFDDPAAISGLWINC